MTNIFKKEINRIFIGNFFLFTSSKQIYSDFRSSQLSDTKIFGYLLASKYKSPNKVTSFGTTKPP